MSFVLWDKLRLFFKRGNVFNHENLLQNQPDPGRVLTGGAAGLTDRGFLLETAQNAVNRSERYKDYDQMDEVGEITLACDLYADEASIHDSERNHTIFVKTGSLRVKKEVEEFLYDTLNIDQLIRPIVRYVVKYGDFACELVPDQNRSGIATIKNIPVYNFTRVETKFGDLVGFYFQEDTSEPIFCHPWQICHIRLISFEQIFVPYGKAVLDGARRDFRRLRLMEDAALVYRLSRAPYKRVFKVPVGNIPPKDREQYIEIIARRFKKHKFIDPATGAINEKYAPHIQDDDYWIPVLSDGSGVEIDTLQGAENLDAIADIEYFKKKMVSALKIPFHRVGLGEPTGDPGKSIASQSPEFSKAVQWIQDQVVVGVKKIVLVHLALRGFPVEDLKNFELAMTSASAIDELYRIETWASRVDIMGGLKDLGIFPDEWIVNKFTDLTEDELKLIKINKDNEAKDDEKEGGEEGGLFESKLRKFNKIYEELELLDYIKKSKSDNNKFSKYASFTRLFNENEFDGLNGVGESSKEHEQAKMLVEKVLRVNELELDDKSLDLIIESNS